MLKKLLGILISTVVMMFIMGYGIMLLTKDGNEEEIAETEIIETGIIETEITPERYTEEKIVERPVEEHPMDEFLFDTKIILLEEQVQTIIHSMSHEKVIAEHKFGLISMAPERIVRLIDVIETNYNEYEHSDLYLDILNRWNAGDFTVADKDHNAIWELQGGGVGEATGVLNTVEQF